MRIFIALCFFLAASYADKEDMDNFASKKRPISTDYYDDHPNPITMGKRRGRDRDDYYYFNLSNEPINGLDYYYEDKISLRKHIANDEKALRADSSSSSSEDFANEYYNDDDIFYRRSSSSVQDTKVGSPKTVRDKVSKELKEVIDVIQDVLETAPVVNNGGEGETPAKHEPAKTESRLSMPKEEAEDLGLIQNMFKKLLTPSSETKYVVVV